MTPAALLTLGSLLALGPAALAQSGPDSSGPQAAAPGPGAEAAERWPVLAVTSVEVVHTHSKPEISAIVVRGLTSSEGWDNGQLVPLSHGTPTDGVLDLVFVADAPGDASDASGLSPMHAVLPLSADHPFKAVRVRGATNVVLLKELQGVTEAQPPKDPCNKCVGLYLLPEGGSAPAGVPASQIMHEKDLPEYARIIHATDGIAEMSRNPNRLTVMVGEDGRIVSAAWD
jgi:hypothetical protein